MDLGTLLGVVIGALSFLGTVAGAIYAYGRLNEQVKDHASEIGELKGRVEKAEGAATQVAGLAQAVEHVAEKFTTEIRHLVDTFAIETGHTRSQLTEIKDELRSVRSRSRAQ